MASEAEEDSVMSEAEGDHSDQPVTINNASPDSAAVDGHSQGSSASSVGSSSGLGTAKEGEASGATIPTAATIEGDVIPVHSCSYGARLGYASFAAARMPTAESLNKQSETSFFFTIDTALIYLSFYQDWGPLNVAMFYRFSLHLHGLLEDKDLAGKKIVLFSSDEHDKKANAALLMALYSMIVLRWTPAEALHPVSHLELRPFRDAGYARADFHLSLQDVVYGIKKGIDNRLLRLDEFDVREYETYEKVENGDWNFVTPHFLAFASPVEPGYSAQQANETLGHLNKPLEPSTAAKLPKAFRNVLEQFEKKNVKMVIRLNKKLYNASHFTSRNMQHLEMFYEDGTNPTLDQCRQFIDVADHHIRNDGVVAVHCKAGLGRTGTLIGAYMIYKWGFTASESIAFQRFMRPGCVVGPQQHFLYQNQLTWVRWAATDSASNSTRSLPAVIASSPIARPDTPPSETEIASQIEAAKAAASASNAHVPGQPRKTPGAKSRHAVALPETNDETQDPADELMLVKTVPESMQDVDRAEDTMQVDVQATREAQQAQHAADNDMEVEILPARPRPPRKASLQGKAEAKAANTSRPPSRSGKAVRTHARPLVDRHNSNANLEDAVIPAIPRTKTTKNFTTLAEGKGRAAPAQPSSPTSGSERYNLRTASRSTSSGQISTLTALTPPSPPEIPSIPVAPANINASPSRLPTRVTTKRKNNHGRPVQVAHKDVFSSNAPPYAAHKVSRNLRKRRPSIES